MNLKKWFLVYFLIFFAFVPVWGQTNAKTFKVVIDAGHGGHDPGCQGNSLREKDVNLDAALRVGKLIEENCKDVKVVYTRKTDVFVELYRRAQIANNEHADLFISFHCNSAENSTGNGVETYVMGLAKSEANQAVARKENAAMLMEKNYQTNYDGFNPNSPESNVIFSLYSSAYLNNSVAIASRVQKNLLTVSHMTDRGVKQAGYWVLYKVAMPSILIEMGFLSNPSDAAFLGNKSNMERLAVGIYNAFADYVSSINGNQYKHLPMGGGATNKPEKPEQPAKPDNKPDKADTVKHTTPLAQDNVTSKADTPATPDSGIRFKVQFLASPDKIDKNDKRLQGVPDVGCYQENGLWKYTAGNERTYEAASELLATVKKIHGDAFMIAFQGDKKISVAEARQLLKK
ncbi:MAG: N-acetylmuramoyl-L-alanine amidase [Bacteroidales bacterium]|nr:N-acetylmuramoyl-L-alanine amidase [Bacteroidales bacterium]